MSIKQQLDKWMVSSTFYLYHGVRWLPVTFEQLDTLFGEDISSTLIRLPEKRFGYSPYHYLFQESSMWYRVYIDPCSLSKGSVQQYVIVNESLPIPSLYTPLDEEFVHQLLDRQRQIQLDIRQLKSESSIIEQAVSHPSCRLYGLFHS